MRRPTEARRGRFAGAALLALLASGPAALADPAPARNNEGNRLYNQKRYDEALKLYTDAQASRPGAPELHYNIGNVLYRKGEYDKAAEEYLKAQAAADPALAEAASFNRGNALMMQKRLQEAIGSYVQSLHLKPDDPAAKRNLELALRMLQEQQQQQKQQDNKKNQDKDQKQDQSQGQPQQKPGSPSGAPNQGKGAPGEMTPEEARQVLEALRDAEKEGIRKHARAGVPEQQAPEKDW